MLGNLLIFQKDTVVFPMKMGVRGQVQLKVSQLSMWLQHHVLNVHFLNVWVLCSTVLRFEIILILNLFLLVLSRSAVLHLGFLLFRRGGCALWAVSPWDSWWSLPGVSSEPSPEPQQWGLLLSSIAHFLLVCRRVGGSQSAFSCYSNSYIYRM